MITVTLSYPNGSTQKTLLEGVPRTGDFIRLKNGLSDLLSVTAVVWVQGSGGDEPEVLIKVEPQREGPRV